MRQIIHIDMDAFYASVEQRDFPQYRGKAVVVGGDPASRGVVATCSYEARKFGIHSAMPCAHAQRLCPNAIFVRPRFEVYREISQQIRNIMNRYTELVEPLSLDEAYLDVSDCKIKIGSATLIAKEIKKEILQTTALHSSAGISYNKFLAKIASDLEKPNGLTLITKKQGPEFVKNLPIGKFFGIGPATEERMNSLGIYTGEDLLSWNLQELQAIFGKASEYYYHAARGEDNRKVEQHRQRKSIGSETTFEQDMSQHDVMLQKLGQLSAEVWHEMTVKGYIARTVTVKVKFDNFTQLTRSKTLNIDITKQEQITEHLPELLEKAKVDGRKVRLLGVTVSNLTEIDRLNKEQQLLLI